MESNKECLHYFVTGYVAELIIYCKKCNKEVGELYGNEVYGTHELIDGNLKQLKPNNNESLLCKTDFSLRH